MGLEKGLVQLYVGDGKGKTSAAIGLAIRAVGAKLKVCMIQFLKAKPSSEVQVLKFLGVGLFRCGSKDFVDEKNISQLDIDEAKKGFDHAKKMIASGFYDVVILDEVCAAIKYGLLDEKDLLDVLEKRPENVEVVLTGRVCSDQLRDYADLCTEMKCIIHPFDSGVAARHGIEF